MRVQQNIKKSNIFTTHSKKLEVLWDTVQPIAFMDAAIMNSNHQIANAVLLAGEVNKRFNDYVARRDRTHTTSEKTPDRYQQQ